MTDSLIARICQHRRKLKQGFTSRYGVDLLVWYETYDTREAVFRRERQMKKWNRLWKLELIERFNPGWRDLYSALL